MGFLFSHARIYNKPSCYLKLLSGCVSAQIGAGADILLEHRSPRSKGK